MASIINDNFDVRAPKPVDKRYSKAGNIPYISAAEAHSLITYKAIGVPIMIGADISNFSLYCYRGGTNVGNIVPMTNIADIPTLQSSLDDKADLVGGLVPSGQLPSYVDDVLEYANSGAFPVTGESGKIYVSLNNGHTWRWTGSMYLDLTVTSGTTDASLLITGLLDNARLDSVPATKLVQDSTHRFATDTEKSTATSHFANTSNPHSVTKAQVGLSLADNTADASKPVSTAQQTALDLKGNINAQAWTGIHTFPTATPGTNTLQAASTAFVTAAVGAATTGVSQFNGRTGAITPTTGDYTFAQVGSKPTTIGGYGISDAFTQTLADARYSLLGHSHTFGSLTSVPTTLAGYGITDAATSTHTHTFASLTSKPTTLAGYAISDAQTFITAGSNGQYYRWDKTFATLDKAAVGLSNLDNTSDANKPISTATQTALNAKQASLISGTNIKTVGSTTILGSGDIPFPVIWLGDEFVGTGADNTHKVNIDVSQLSVGTLNAARFGAATIPTTAINASGGSTGRVLTYDGTWVVNSGSTDASNLTSGTLADARLSSNIPRKNTANTLTEALTITPSSNVFGLHLVNGTGAPSATMDIGPSAWFGVTSAMVCSGRLDIAASTGDLWLHGSNIRFDGNSQVLAFSETCTSVATQVGSKGAVWESFLWNTGGGGSGVRRYDGWKSIASTSVSLAHRFNLYGAATDTILSDGNLLLSFDAAGIPTFADNTAAGGGGVPTGGVYRTSTGVLMVKF